MFGGTASGVIGIYVQQYVPGGVLAATPFYGLCAWAFGAALFVAWRDQHDRADAAEKELKVIRDAQPDVALMVEDGEFIYLTITNTGGSGDFWTQLQIAGAHNFKENSKAVQAYWESHHRQDHVYIAHGASERIRLAKRVYTNGIAANMRYDVFWRSSFSTEGTFSASDHSTVVTAPQTSNWKVSLTLVILAKPDLVSGPVHLAVLLHGDGTITTQ
jgi:hypothetical protein